MYLGNAECDFKQLFYNYQMSFNNEGQSTGTTISKCLGSKEEAEDNAITKMVHIKSVPAYLNIYKKCQLCLQQKFEILN